MDDLVPDPAHPQAFPSTYPMDLLGRIRVKLTAGDGNLVGYGFGGQRVVIPAKSVGAVLTVKSFRLGKGIVTHDRALLVLDHEDRVLFRANGLWETYGEVAKVCRAAGVPRPTHISGGSGRYRSQAKPRTSTGTVGARFKKAPGYQRLRTHPRGRTLRVLALLVLYGLAMGWGGYLGTLPAMSLPLWFGAVRTLFAIIGAILGVCAGLWVGAVISNVWNDALRWAGASLAAGGLAPARRFFSRRPEDAGSWLAAANFGLVVLFIALCGWGPGVLIVSTAHGLRDSSLVAELRAHGSATQGTLIDVQRFSTDSNGNTTVTDVSTLAFKDNGKLVQTTDPSIGGRPLALDASDPLSTNDPQTIVYLPSNPQVAAARQQIAGSVWHGAPMANVISGSIFTLALPPVFLYLVLRLRRLRWRRAKGLVEDLSRLFLWLRPLLSTFTGLVPESQNPDPRCVSVHSVRAMQPRGFTEILVMRPILFLL